MNRHVITLVTTAVLGMATAWGSGRSLNLQHLDSDDGLSNNYILSMTQDPRGFIWIATEWGLNRFDGENFVTFTKENSGLSSNELNCVLADSDYVWISTQRDGLCRYDYTTGEIEQFTVDKDFLLTNDIPRLSLAADSGMWITHYHLGPQYYNPSTGHSEDFSSNTVEGLPRQCWLTVDDGNGHIYVGHVNDGMSIVDLRTRKVRTLRHDPDNGASLPGNEVFSICIDSNGLVWIGTNNGVAAYNPSQGTITRLTHDPAYPESLLPGVIMDIKQMKNGDIWFASSQGGVSVLDFQNNIFIDPKLIRFTNITANSEGTGLYGTYFRSILQDTFGNVWLGSYRSGIDFISSMPTVFSKLPYSSAHTWRTNFKAVWSACCDHDGNLWLGSENEIACFNGDKELKRLTLPSSTERPHAYVRALYEDHNRTLWIGTNEGGIMTYDLNTSRFERVARWPRDIRCFYEDGDGTLLIGTRDGLYSKRNGAIAPESDINSILMDNIIQGICRDNRDRLWIGTFGKGITVLNPDGTLLRFFTINDATFPSNAVNAVKRDSKGNIWVATRNGIVRFSDSDNPSTYRVYGLSDGLENPHVRAIEEDAEGNIWFSTNTGLARLDPESDKIMSFHHYADHRLGSFLDNSSTIARDGKLYFGSLNGIYSFSPRTVSDNRNLPPVVISSFGVFDKKRGKSVDEEISMPLADDKITLNHNQNSFRISFSVMDYTYSHQVDYSYSMKGLEKGWYNTNGENSVTFRNLAPGKYEFQVRSRIYGHDWDPKITTLEIVIKAPLWLTWWAKTIYALLALAAIAVVVVVYKRKLDLEQSLQIERNNNDNRQLLNEERLRFYTNITHELRTPLTLILGPLEDLLSDPAMPSRYSNKLRVIHESSQRLLSLINGILEFRKTETQNRKLSITHGNIASLVREIGLRYKELNRNPDVSYVINIEDGDTELCYDREMITTILDNLMSNAKKYTPKGSIVLSLRTEENKNRGG